MPYWTATSGGMAANFFVDGFGSDGGWGWSWILCGAVMLCFAIPGLYLMSPWQKLYDREPVKGAPLTRTQWWLGYLVLVVVGIALGSWSAYAWL